LTKKIIAAALIGCAFTTAVLPAKAESLGCSYASHYGVGDGYHGQRTANGETFNAYGLSAAHRSLPFGTKLRVTDATTQKAVIIRINDRGPYVHNRVLDLSYGAFSAITSPGKGVTKVCIAKV
jgi:rare lipoprotein A